MEHNTSPSTIAGFILTMLLWITAKITISDVASIATVLSGCVVLFINIPKIKDVYIKHIKRKRRR